MALLQTFFIRVRNYSLGSNISPNIVMKNKKVEMKMPETVSAPPEVTNGVTPPKMRWKISDVSGLANKKNTSAL